MADKKVSQLTSLTLPANVDLLLIIDDPNGTPISKKISLKDLFGNVPANTAISGTLTVSANTTFSGSRHTVSANAVFTSPTGPVFSARYLKIAKSTGSISNNTTTELGAGMQGSMFFDSNYAYFATSNTVIKRVALSNFAS